MRKILIRLILVAIITTSATPIVLNNNHASALSGSDFQAGRIIEDFIFFDANGLSQQSIQDFLSTKVPTCDTNGTQPYSGTTRGLYGTSKGYPPPYTCLKDYRIETVAKPVETGLCNGYPRANQSAAQIIYGVAQSCGINPKVLIVLLQKEQGLVTDDWPWASQYQKATGYGCPDTAPCDAQYYGFFNQVYSAARQFKNYAKNPNNYNFRSSRNNSIQFNPSASCGASTVFIQNQATAGLYNYTPYQPNAAALAVMNDSTAGGSVDCGAYGNRNFFWYFTKWFGSTRYGSLVSTPGDGVYFIDNGQKRPFPSEIIFQSYSYSWANVTVINPSELALIPNGAAMPYNVHYRDGQLITMDGNSIYLVVDGQKRNIPSESVFLSYSWKWSYIRALSLQEFSSIPDGAAMPYNVHYRDGQLLRATGSTGVYLIQNGTKRAFPSAETFLGNGYQWASVSNVSSTELGLIPPGLDMPYNVHYRDGQLITMDGNSIYLVVDGQKRNIPSESVFLSYSWKWSYIRALSLQEFSSIPDGAAMPYNTTR